MRPDPTRSPSPPEPESHSFTPSPAPRPELLGNPDPGFRESARRVGLARETLYYWFRPTFPGHIIVKALLSRPSLTLPAVAQRLWVTPQTVRGWIPAWIQVRLVRFLLLRAGLSLTQVARRVDIPIDTLTHWIPRQQRLQIARQLLIRNDLSLAQVAARLGLRPGTLRRWFPRQQRLQIARQLLIRSDLSLAQVAARLGLRPDTLRWPQLSPADRFHFARQLLVYTRLPLDQVADRLEISINTLTHWFPNLKKKGNTMTPKSKRRYIGYARVSTLDQDPDHQIKALKAAGCERIFTDQASGAVRARPELTKALNCVVGGDTLIVWKFDRLGRSLQHLIEIVTSLGERQVQLRSLTQGIDTRTPIGKMTFSIMAALAEFEHCLISERTKLAAMRRHEKQQHWGRPSQFHDPERVKLAQRLLRSDLPRQEVAARLEISLPALYKWFPGGDPDRFGTGAYGAGRASLRGSLSPVEEKAAISASADNHR